MGFLAHRFRLHGVGLAVTLASACAHTTPLGGDANRTASGAPPPCVGDRSCELVQRIDAGASRVVWETTRGQRDVETGEPASGEDARTCELREWWLEDEGGFARVLVLCNDGYGASGVGEDEVAFADGGMTHTQSGGSAWRWSSTREIALSPYRVLRESTNGYWNIGANAEHRELDYTTFAGSVEWFSPSCAMPEEERESLGVAALPPGLTHAYVVIPVLPIDARFDPARIDASGCGTHVDGSGERGFLLEGTPSDAADASLDILVSTDKTITVVIHDDAFVPSGATPGDRLRVYFGERRPSYFEHCLDDEGSYSWEDFDADTGRSLGVNPTVLEPAVGRAPGGRYVRIAHPGNEITGSFTFVYSDVDAVGGPFERVFASSTFRDEDPWSLGMFEAGLVETTRCVVEGNTLVRHHDEAEVRSPFGE